jgi:GNAT superfamily N-acetyltransferase
MATTASSSQVLTIRTVEAGDAASVAELTGQLGYPVTQKEIAQRIAWALAHTDAQTIFVACLNGEAVGWIEAAIEHHLQSPPFALITGLVVRDGVRSLGVGRRLCEEVERWTRDKGLDMVRVTSRSTREAAHRFYLRDGYRLIKTSAVFEKPLS